MASSCPKSTCSSLMLLDADRSVLMSHDDKLRLVCNFLLLSPPGQFHVLSNDLRVLLKNDELFDNSVKDIIKYYNKQQLVPANVGAGKHKVIISMYNELANNRYFDPRSCTSFEFDHFNHKISNPLPMQLHTNTEAFRKALDQEVLRYVNAYYKNGNCSVFSKSVEKKTILIVCIENHKYNLDSSCNGQWRAVWLVKFEKDQKPVQLKGEVKFHVHYFENANVQLLCAQNYKEMLDATKPVELAKKVVKAILEKDNVFQRYILEQLRIMSALALKELRRTLPISKTMFNWSRALKNGQREMEKGMKQKQKRDAKLKNKKDESTV